MSTTKELIEEGKELYLTPEQAEAEKAKQMNKRIHEVNENVKGAIKQGKEAFVVPEVDQQIAEQAKEIRKVNESEKAAIKEGEATYFPK